MYDKIMFYSGKGDNKFSVTRSIIWHISVELSRFEVNRPNTG